ncbi:Dipeptidyl-peptidase IV [uncultured Paludibacter sp.]|nr:Dipeptidyl-peptidase IV [uncultured Paludibacter sp.]
MKQILFLLLLIFTASISKADLLTDITDGKFKAKTPAAFHSLKDGEHFTQLIDNKYIVKFNFKTGNAVDTLFNFDKLKGFPYDKILGYSFSNDEKKLLVYSNQHYRYRRTFTSSYYIYNIVNKEIKKLSDRGEQEAPLFSPDGNLIAFARENNIYLKNLQTDTETAVTTDGVFNKIINGTPDWVYEEEFELTRYFSFSPDSKCLSYLKFDESNVPLFSMMRYLNNDADKNDLLLYPTVETFKYPKPGQNNSLVSVHLFDLQQNKTSQVQLPKMEEEFYIPRLNWTNNADKLAVYVLNRHQNRLEMFLADKSRGEVTSVWSDTDNCYVDYENIDDIQFLSDNKRFIYVSEKDGYRHAYIYDMPSKTSKQLTKGDWDITKVYGFDEKNQTLFYQSAEISPLQRDIYSVSLKGKKLRLTDGKGTHNADFSTTFAYFADNFSSLSVPNMVTLRTNKGKTVRELINNQSLSDDFNQYNFPKKEFFQFTTSEGIILNGWILKPQNQEENKKYSLLMVQYSGPNSQQVLDSWKMDWEYFLCTQGYAVACVDGRGTGARGSEFRKCTYKQLGVLETKDQVEAAKYLGSLRFVDKERMGIWGWSYGGFMVLNAMSTGENIFKVGIAVAPVTDWRLYNSAYTERFMRTPQENPEGYAAGSPLSKVKNLEGNVLIIHGTADDNVHLQNTMIYLNKLTDAGKQVQLYTYTDKNHSILGRETRRHLYKKKFEFLEKNLK